MWHGSVHVVGYRENHVVLATGMVWAAGAYTFAMIPPLHTHSLVPDVTLGIARLLGDLTLDVVLAWRGVVKGYLHC